ncbi:MAG TPA: four helix bundle protein [Terriglobales bacterium]|jgi:four helix bundle protein
MEVETQIMIAERLGYLAPDSSQALLRNTGEVGKIMNGLIKSLT